MTTKRISVVGAGHVGATCSQLLAQKELAQEVILLDIVEGIPQGKGLDQWESAPIEGFDSRVIGANSYEVAEGSEVFIVTAGIARKPGMSRWSVPSRRGPSGRGGSAPAGRGGGSGGGVLSLIHI